MKKRIYLLLTILIAPMIIVLSYNEETIKIKKIEKQGAPSYEISYDIGIEKKDELGNLLSGVEFTLKDVNNTFSKNIEETEIPGIYELNDWEMPDLETLFNMFPANQRDELKSLKTREQIENSNIIQECEENRCYSYGILPFILEETKVPSGYIKEKYYVFGFYDLMYIFNDNNTLSNTTLGIYINS